MATPKWSLNTVMSYANGYNSEIVFVCSNCGRVIDATMEECPHCKEKLEGSSEEKA